MTVNFFSSIAHQMLHNAHYNIWLATELKKLIAINESFCNLNFFYTPKI